VNRVDIHAVSLAYQLEAIIAVYCDQVQSVIRQQPAAIVQNQSARLTIRPGEHCYAA